MARNPTARADAKARGDKYYTTGEPCKNGHTAPRAVVSGSCTECTKLAAKAWLAQRPEKAAGYTAAYRERNAELVREKDRVAQAAKRAADPEHSKYLHSKAYAKKVAAEGREVRPFNRLPIADLISRLQSAHAGTLQYVSGYTHMNTKATFLCVLHKEEVAAHPANVLSGANPCTKCNHMRSSGEEAVAALLSAFTPLEQRNRTLLKPRELDIYIPGPKLAVEYCGDFWHSHRDAESEKKDKNKHYQKYVDCKALGIRLITLYESEWLGHNYAVRRLLRNALGKGKGKLMARKCELKKVEHAAATAFYDRYHPQGGAGSGVHYGLFWKGKLVACMRFVLGANDRGAGASNRVWTLGRYATRITVAGAASRLFKAFVAEHNPPMVKSFSDNRYFEGGMYEQLGFTLDEETPPDYQVWHPKLGLRPKSRYQRRQLPARLKEVGSDISFDPETDPRTEAEMTYLMGAGRIYDCGKKRWLWTPTPQP